MSQHESEGRKGDEVRCRCGKLLAISTGRGGRIEIKCPRCKGLNDVRLADR